MWFKRSRPGVEVEIIYAQLFFPISSMNGGAIFTVAEKVDLSAEPRHPKRGVTSHD